MAKVDEELKGAYRLEVPLDASGVKDLKEVKPDRAVKVAAFPAKGEAQERVAKFEENGKAKVTFSYEAFPGRLRVVVGPENATIEQLKGLQTIAVDVLPRQWQGQRMLTLKPILISPFYWKWWWWWCRKFKITGKVIVPTVIPCLAPRFAPMTWIGGGGGGRRTWWAVSQPT